MGRYKTKKISKSGRIKSKKRRVKVYNLKKVMTNEEIANKAGHYFDKKDFKYIVKEDADGYYIDENGKKNLLFRFRKGVIPRKLCKIGIKHLKKYAMKKHDNRGAAAGVLDLKQLPTYVDLNRIQPFMGKYRVKGFYSNVSGKYINHTIGNLSQSNIIGYFDRHDRNLGKGAPPCRKTAFTAQQVENGRQLYLLLKLLIDNLKNKFQKHTKNNMIEHIKPNLLLMIQHLVH